MCRNATYSIAMYSIAMYRTATRRRATPAIHAARTIHATAAVQRVLAAHVAAQVAERADAALLLQRPQHQRQLLQPSKKLQLLQLKQHQHQHQLQQLS